MHAKGQHVGLRACMPRVAAALDHQRGLVCFVLGVASVLLMVRCVHYFRPLSCWRCTIENTSDAGRIISRGDSERQDPTVAALVRFRAHVAPLLQQNRATLDRIVALRRWARALQSDEQSLWLFSPGADSGDIDPEILLQQQRAGTPGACRRFGYVLAGALLSADIPARLVSLQSEVTDGSGHIMVEAWVHELDKWVLVDPTRDTMFLVNGRYASLLELRRALAEGKQGTIRFERNGSTLHPEPSIDYFTRTSRHAFVYATERLFRDPPLTKVDVWRFRVLHYVDDFAEPYPEIAKKATIAGAIVFGGCGTVLLSAAAVLLMRYLLRRFRLGGPAAEPAAAAQ